MMRPEYNTWRRHVRGAGIRQEPSSPPSQRGGGAVMVPRQLYMKKWKKKRGKMENFEEKWKKNAIWVYSQR